MTDLDVRLAASFSAWVEDNREGLSARDVTVHVDGPHAPVGMDFVYLLRLDSARAECEAVLFLGGMVSLSTFDKGRRVAEESHLDAATEPALTAALTLLAHRA